MRLKTDIFSVPIKQEGAWDGVRDYDWYYAKLFNPPDSIADENVIGWCIKTHFADDENAFDEAAFAYLRNGKGITG